MEFTAASWAGPYELQLAMNWTSEVAPEADDDDQVWAPAVGHPLQYASIVDIFGSSCSLQTYVVTPSSCPSEGQQQLVEYNYYNYYASAAQHHDPDPMETYMNSPDKLFSEMTTEFMDDAKLLKTKMHRYPPSIQDLGDWYTVPKVVAIGPYYHRRDHLQKAERMKHVAALYCIVVYRDINKTSGSSGPPLQHMYDTVASVAAKIDARSLYDKDVMAGIGYETDFLPMMFYDACFLVIFILRMSGTAVNQDLLDFFRSNDSSIAHDIMLLENQIPLQVVHAVLNMCTADPLETMKRFITRWRAHGLLQDLAVMNLPRANRDQDYYNKAPHLLGLVRFYAVGKRSKKFNMSSSDVDKIESFQMSSGAVELAKMGIFLTANQTAELPDVGLARKWIIFNKLSMAPLSLNDARASLLVNMAALELCTTPNFFRDTAEPEDSAVCSYLPLLCMLMHREEDVHELRTKGILQGGAGLTNKNTLDFFTSLQSLRKGPCYLFVMIEIQNYKNKRPRMIKVYAFLYNHWKYVVGVASAFGGFIGIITALMRLKGAH